MAKLASLEEEIAKMKEKVRAKLASTENPEADPVARQLRKRLKRLQRKRRKLLMRQQAAKKEKAAS